MWACGLNSGSRNAVLSCLPRCNHLRAGPALPVGPAVAGAPARPGLRVRARPAAARRFGTEGLIGKVGGDVSETDAYEGARLTGLAMLSSLQRALGDLDRVTGWLRVFGMVNVAPGFTRTPAVINGFSDLILDLWGPETGAHARSAIGVAELPLGLAIEIEAEVAVD